MDRQWRQVAFDSRRVWRLAPRYLRFRRWAVRGVWDQIMAHVVAQGEPQLAFACIDGMIARAHQKASGARPGDAAAKDLS